MRLGLDITEGRSVGVVLDAGGAVAAQAIRADPAAALDALATRVPERIARVVLVVRDLAAAVERGGRGASRVGVVRIGAPAAAAVPPLTGWPAGLRDALRGPVAMVGGGHEYDGREIAPLDRAAVERFGRACRGRVAAVAVAAVNSQFSAVHEELAAATLADVLGVDVPVITGAEVGGVGLLERENTAVLDAALAPVARRRLDELAAVVAARLPEAALYLMRGDGTVFPAAAAVRHPLQTLGAGQGGALRGAVHLSGHASAVVAAATEGGVQVSASVDGLAQESGLFVEVDGVRTALRGRWVTELPWPCPADRLRAALTRSRTRLGPDVPLVAVGERASELPEPLLRPDGAELACAVGAAAGEASGAVDRIFWIGTGSRAAAAETARTLARDAAVRAGADPKLLRETAVQEALMTYVPVACARLRVTAVGPLLDDGGPPWP